MALCVNGLYSLYQQAKGFATFGRNHRLGAVPLGLVVKAFLNFKQVVVLGLIGHELAFFIAIDSDHRDKLLILLTNGQGFSYVFVSFFPRKSARLGAFTFHLIQVIQFVQKSQYM